MLNAITRIFRPAKDSIGARWAKAPVHTNVPAHLFNALRADAISVQRSAGQNNRFSRAARQQLATAARKIGELSAQTLELEAEIETAHEKAQDQQARIAELEVILADIVGGIDLYDRGAQTYAGGRQVHQLLNAARRAKQAL